MFRRLSVYFATGAAALILSCAPARALDCSPGPFVIFFDSDDAYVDKAAMETLEYTRDIARACGSRKLRLEGHSDTLENVTIVRKRLEVVRAYLMSHGIPRDDILTKFYGKKDQRIPTGPKVSERQNRRIVINFYPSP